MANSGVNVKMGVTGVAQFKQNINTAKQSLKTLDAQLALNEKQYRASGDAEAYMEEKSQLLQLKLAEQKAVIANTERALKDMADNGVDKGSKAFQEMQRQLLGAKGDLIDTQTQMENLAVNSEDAGNNVDSMNQQLKRIGDGVSFQNVTNGLEKINSKIGGLIRNAGRLGRALIQNTLGAGAWADDLMTRVSKYKDLGVTPQQLQQMDKAAELVDTDTETILGAKDKMVKNINSGNEEVLGTFAAINKYIDPTLYTKSAGGIEFLFWEAGKFLTTITDVGKKEEYAQRLFGKSWRELEPLFSTGRQKYNQIVSEQSYVNQEQIDSLTAMDDQYHKLTGEWETFKMTVLATLSDTLTPLMEKLTDLIKQFNEYLKSPEGQEMLKKISDIISGLFEDLMKIDPDKVMEGVTGAFEKVKEGLEWIWTNKDTLIKALEAIGIAFGALKITEIALGIGKVVGGFKNLLGLGAEKAAETATTTAASNAPAAAATGGGLKAAIGSFFGPGSSFSMAGGLSVAGPLAAFLAAGYAGWKMIDANLHDASLNKIYGQGQGAEDNSMIMTMTPEQWRAAKEYFDLIQDENATGEQRANARERLYNELETGYGEHTELAVDYLEKAFDEWSRGWNEDGLVEAIERRYPGFFETDPETRNLNFMDDLVNEQSQTRKTNDELAKAAEDMKNLPDLMKSAVSEGMSNVRIYIDGQQAGTVLAPYVGQAQGGAVALMVTQ